MSEDIPIEDAQSPDYRYVYATGAFGGITPIDAKIIFYLDRLVPRTLNEGEEKGRQITGKIIRELQVEVHMSPQEFIEIYKWMGKHIDRFKQNFPKTIPYKQESSQPREKSNPNS